MFHRYVDGQASGPSLFMVTNMVNPGSFPVSLDDDFTTPGVAFYLLLPCIAQADMQFNLMLETAQTLADRLNADVLDHERHLMTPTRLMKYREKAQRYTQ